MLVAAGAAVPAESAVTEPVTSPSSRAAITPEDEGATVTLITGDVIEIGPVHGDRFGYVVSPAPGRTAHAVSTTTDGTGDVHVVPLDVAASHVELDPALFNVSALVRAGLTDADAQTIKLALEVDPSAASVVLPGADRLVRVSPNLATTTLDRDRAAELGAALAGDRLAPTIRSISLVDGPSSSETPLDETGGMALVELTVRVLDRDGEPFPDDAFGYVYTVNLADDVLTYERWLIRESEFTIELEPGDYAIAMQAEVPNEAGGTDLVSIDLPQVDVSRDSTVVLDGRTTVEATIDVGEPVTVAYSCISTWRTNDDARTDAQVKLCGGGSLSDRIYVAPTTRPTIGEYEHYTRWVLLGENFFDLVMPERRRVPDDLSYVLDPDDVARFITTYPGQPGAPPLYWVTRFPWRPYEHSSGSRPFNVYGPTIRDEVLSAGLTRWWKEVHSLNTNDRRYPRGHMADETWFAQPIRSASIRKASIRTGNSMVWKISPFVDADRHPGPTGRGRDVVFRLYADGDLIDTRQVPRGRVRVPSGESAFRAELITGGLAPAVLSTRVTTRWWFDSDTAPPAGVALPLLQVDYDLGLDEVNTVALPSTFSFEVGHAAEELAIPVASVTVELSLDGTDWVELEVETRATAPGPRSPTTPTLNPATGPTSGCP